LAIIFRLLARNFAGYLVRTTPKLRASPNSLAAGIERAFIERSTSSMFLYVIIEVVSPI